MKKVLGEEEGREGGLGVIVVEKVSCSSFFFGDGLDMRTAWFGVVQLYTVCEDACGLWVHGWRVLQRRVVGGIRGCWREEVWVLERWGN